MPQAVLMARLLALEPASQVRVVQLLEQVQHGSRGSACPPYKVLGAPPYNAAGSSSTRRHTEVAPT